MAQTEPYPQAIQQPSPNFNAGRRGETVQFICVHITDGQPDVERTVARFCDGDTQASPHFVVGQAGEVFQLVGVNDTAWHASGWNRYSVGIEHVARSRGEFHDWHGYSLEKRAKLLPVGLSTEALEGETDPGFPVTNAQLEASARLVAWLCRVYGWTPDRTRIRPHCECPDTSHLDCGRDWPWDRYLEMVAACLEDATQLS